MARSTDSPYVRAYLRGTARTATLASEDIAAADTNLRQGDVVELTAGARQVPGQIAPLLDGRLVKSAELSAVVALHAVQTAEPWWIADAVSTTAQKRFVDGAKV